MMDKENIIIADCDAAEIDDVLKGIEEVTQCEWRIESKISNWGRNTKWMNIKRYILYFWTPWKIFIRRKKYDKIVGWQQFYALIFCFFCSVFQVKKTFTVCAVNYTYKPKKGIVGIVYYNFMKYITNSKYLDYIYVPSYKYVDICHKELGIDKEKIVVLPFGIPDIYEKYKNSKTNVNEKYVLAIGRSNRDYEWLIEEWKSIDFPLWIISDTYRHKDELPGNIKIIDNIAGDKQFPYIANCSFLILPIKDGDICSGDTVLLTAMSFKKTVIVTNHSTLAEMYIKGDDNGIIVDKNPGKLKQCIEKMIKNKVDLGNSARESFLSNYSRLTMGKRIGKSILKK